ncbi:hypothetical protein RRG08_044279 [Elysia crispata]|uniref:Uncharacterized protein n=1 Tax=Elysia crispata TaxID=231223 RepID=A0AAE0XY37_9GAST|nr:hypothetical protein RRG08_044279 [Elysia crispata]
MFVNCHRCTTDCSRRHRASQGGGAHSPRPLVPEAREMSRDLNYYSSSIYDNPLVVFDIMGTATGTVWTSRIMFAERWYWFGPVLKIPVIKLNIPLSTCRIRSIAWISSQTDVSRPKSKQSDSTLVSCLPAGQGYGQG